MAIVFKLQLFILLLSVFLFHQAQGNAKLLASKIILNEFLVEEKDLTVVYSIYNIGSSTAQSVSLRDDSFYEGDFEIVNGLLSVTWDKIPANNNVTHTVIVRPKFSNIYNMSYAQVKYSDEESNYVGYTSAPGYIRVLKYNEFSREHVSHVVDWLAFALMASPTIGIPFIVWYWSHSYYEALKGKKQA
ncbi:translocon-associated protein subunit beta-like [Dysidea avara]|uniref:translocon-associated protein subunit beta-like n=1 Tax=Dysidea avara TaxID=196820 RepID=UPI0033247A4C